MGKPIGIKYTKHCIVCGTEFIAASEEALYCSQRCKEKAYEARRKGEELKKAKPKKRDKTPHETIVEMNEKARAMGMTYGKYQMMQYKIHRGTE